MKSGERLISAEVELNLLCVRCEKTALHRVQFLNNNHCYSVCPLCKEGYLITPKKWFLLYGKDLLELLDDDD